MADYVIDINVLIQADKPPEELNEIEQACAQACLEWLVSFALDGSDRIVFDNAFKIFNKYIEYVNKRPGGFGKQWLTRINERLSQTTDWVSIEFDDDGYAILPESIPFNDLADRKFIAVTLAHPSHPSIINATDTDWAKQKALLEANGVEVIELCPDYIARKLTEQGE